MTTYLLDVNLLLTRVSVKPASLTPAIRIPGIGFRVSSLSSLASTPVAAGVTKHAQASAVPSLAFSMVSTPVKREISSNLTSGGSSAISITKRMFRY